MSLTVTEAQAVFDLLRWLGPRPDDTEVVDVAQAAGAAQLLLERAGKRLQIGVRTDEGSEAVLRHAERLAAAEAVCEAIAEHLRHGGTLPWPSIRHPYERWAEVGS